MTKKYEDMNYNELYREETALSAKRDYCKAKIQAKKWVWDKAITLIVAYLNNENFDLVISHTEEVKELKDRICAYENELKNVEDQLSQVGEYKSEFCDSVEEC